jgi:endonuclease I
MRGYHTTAIWHIVFRHKKNRSSGEIIKLTSSLPSHSTNVPGETMLAFEPISHSKLTLIMLLVSSSIALADAPDGYYTPADDLEGHALRGAVHDIIVNHEVHPYSSVRFDVHDAIDILDELDGDESRVQLIYSDATATKISWPGYNREHVWPVSLGSAHGTPAYTDLHHIFACDANINSARSNRPYDECGGDCNTHVEAPDTFYTSRTWEPPDSDKGDVARALFYMDLRYEGDINGEPNLRLVEWGVTAGCNCMGRLSKLRRWHQFDPVDDRERSRNDRVFQLQGNRNPFIDNPQWVDSIFDAPVLNFNNALTIFDPMATSPWINELHYENDGPDVGEGLEIAGPAGTWLNGWTVMLYNGRDGRGYAEVGLEGRIDDEGLGYGAVWFEVPNLQNGEADGLALIDPMGNVVEFISYEGSLTANDGPAIKEHSQDIGVSQFVDTEIGSSLQRQGAGISGGDFAWASAASSPGILNPNQTIFRSIRLPWIVFAFDFTF